jgi:phosphatidylglycerophosphate synthase
MSDSTFALFNLTLVFGAAFLGMRAFGRTRPDTSAVRGSKILSSNVRAWYYSNLEPFEDLFIQRGVRASTITYTQILASLFCAAAYASGLIYTAGFLMLFTGTLDMLDGKVARRSGGGTSRGAFLDSVVDRYAEFFVLVGLMVFFADGWRVWAVLLAMLGGMMVSYTRARAEGLGAICDVGLLQRPERVVILGFGSIFSSVAVHSVGGDHELLTVTVVLLAVLSNITAMQRIVHTSGLLSRERNG